ncbi:MAG: hypothetical protein RLZZ303_2494 [Candidatus Hydrogenedentota bacterium]
MFFRNTALALGWTLMTFLAPAGAAQGHSADTTRDWSLSLSELLRVVQLFNVGSYGCAEVSESNLDGYAAGASSGICPYHHADYLAPRWKLTLEELLRVIQLYNAGGFGVDCGSEDGYAIDSFQVEGECPRKEPQEGEAEGLAEGGDGENEIEGETEGQSEGGFEGGFEGIHEGSTEGQTEGSDEGSLEGDSVDSCAMPCMASCNGSAPTINPPALLAELYNFASVAGLSLDPNTSDADENGMIDSAQMMLIDAVFKDTGLAAHCCVVNAFLGNLPPARAYVDELKTVPIAQLVVTLIGETDLDNAVAGLATLGDPEAITAILLQLQELEPSVPIPNLNLFDASAGQYLAAWGDLDRDGVCNLAEYNAVVSTGVADFPAFVAVATDATVTAGIGDCPPCGSITTEGEAEGTIEGESGEGSEEGEIEGGSEGAMEFPGCEALCEPDWSQGCTPEDEPRVPNFFAGEQTTDVTFIAFGDAETGVIGVDTQSSRWNIAAMNAVESTLRWGEVPFGLDEPVSHVRGVLMAGDITRDGRDGRYNTFNSLGEFTALYGLCGNGDLLYPMYEGYGNHDYFVYDHIGYRIPEAHPVADSVALRNPFRSGLAKTAPGMDGHYSWDWDNVHLVQLNLVPSDVIPDTGVPGDRNPRKALTFLINDLAENVAGTGKRVVIISHYGFYSGWDFNGWWTRDEADDYYQAIKDYDVIAHIHGHAHQTGMYTWNGINVFNVGSPYHNNLGWNPDGRGHFGVFRVTDDYLYAGDAAWNPQAPETDIAFPKNWWAKIPLEPSGSEGE